MLALVLISLALEAVPIGSPSSMQGPVVPVVEVYAPPVVRPFEPASDFGRRRAEGDGDVGDEGTRPYRRLIVRPVVVTDYRHNYEVSRTDAEVGYDQAVAQARLDADDRMGPLDGVWQVVRADGASVASASLDLILSDRGADRPVEGAVGIVSGPGERLVAMIDEIARDEDAVAIDAIIHDRLVALRLRAVPEGWSGTLTGLGPERRVMMIRKPETGG